MEKKFSKKGPKTNEEVLISIKKNGFKIIEKKVFQLPNKKNLKRLIIGASFTGKN